jgi:2,4-diaminopentanoate dehydrogenase
MSLANIRVVQWGCGLMGQRIIRYLTEKGASVVGAIDRNRSRIRNDAGTIAGLPAALAVPVRPPAEAEQVFRDANADVCILCTRNTMAELYDDLALIIRFGVDAITIGEEAFYPWNTSPELTRRLDHLAREQGCTVTGSGYQDVFWGHLVAVLAGATQRIDRIHGLTQYNADDFGSPSAEGIGFSPEQFHEQLVVANNRSMVWQANEWLCARLGWTIAAMTQQLAPLTSEHPVPSRSLGRTITPGEALGFRALVTATTREGPVIETCCVGKVYTAGEVDVNEWSVMGEPSTTVTISRPATADLTCATVVNRLPQVIAAPPGWYTTDRLPPPVYQHYRLEIL